MIKIGITGQAGFVGTHLYNELGLLTDDFVRIPFQDSFFSEEQRLRDFVKQCDVIVHLAAMNRHSDSQVIYKTNLRLVNQLIAAMEAEKVTGEEDTYLRIFGKPYTRVNRRMGVVLCYAPNGSDLDALRDKAKRIADKVEVY